MKQTKWVSGSILKAIAKAQSKENPLIVEDDEIYIKYDEINLKNCCDGLKMTFRFKGKDMTYQIRDGVRFEDDCELTIKGVQGKNHLELRTQ